MEILRVENLTKVYGKGENEVQALDGVSFSVEKGAFVAVIGPSGSGKSTLLHILGGVDRPTGGKVFMDGKDVYAQNEEQLAIFRRRQVGLIYQFYNDHSEAYRPGEPPAEPALRRPAAAGVHRPGSDECACGGACR